MKRVECTPLNFYIHISPSPIPHDALLVLSRVRNANFYGGLIDAYARTKANSHVCEAQRFFDQLSENKGVRKMARDASARILAIIDAPAENFSDFHCLDVIAMVERKIKAQIDLALVIDTEWSNTLKNRPPGWVPTDPIEFPGRPRLYRDPNGAAELIELLSNRHPSVTQLKVTDRTIRSVLERFMMSQSMSKIAAA